MQPGPALCVQSYMHQLQPVWLQAPGGPNRPINQPWQTSSTKIDPSQVPRPSAKGDAPEEYRTSGNQHPNPPTTQARFVVRDTGNANPRFMRCTLSMMPYSNDLLKQSGMPLAAVVQPFALLDPADDPTQVSSCGAQLPLLFTSWPACCMLRRLLSFVFARHRVPVTDGRCTAGLGPNMNLVGTAAIRAQRCNTFGSVHHSVCCADQHAPHPCTNATAGTTCLAVKMRHRQIARTH